MPPRRVYWDSCAFIGLLNAEPLKVDACAAVWEEAVNGRTIIVTSFLTFVEVFKAKCEGPAKPLSEADEERIGILFRQTFIETAVVDEPIALAARRHMRNYPECKKPNDGVHLATALDLDVDEMHTYDGSDLLHLSGKLLRRDGEYLTICKPTPLPAPPPLPDLFTRPEGA